MAIKRDVNARRRCRQMGRILLTAGLIFVLAAGFYGCGQGDEDSTEELATEQEKSLFESPSYSELPEYQAPEGYEETLLYADSQQMIFVLAQPMPKATNAMEASAGGLGNPAEYLVRYVYESGAGTKYELSGNTYVTDAIPYQEGVLFTQYDGTYQDERYEWELCYLTESRKRVCVDRGRAAFIPDICFVDGTPVYVSEDVDPASGQEDETPAYRVMAVDGLKARAILTGSDGQLERRGMTSGSGRYAFEIMQNGKHYLQVGNMDGQLQTFPVEGKHLRNFALAGDHLVYAVGWEEEDKTIRSIDLNDGSEQTAPLNLMFYNLIGGEQEQLLGINEQGLAAVDPKSLQVRQISMPGELGRSDELNLASENMREGKVVLSTSKGFCPASSVAETLRRFAHLQQKGS